MNEKKKHKIMLGIEVILLCMIVAILGTNAASSNPPSNGVSYGKNNQTTVEGALNDLYTKANYGNATASQILKGKTALVGGKQVTGTMENRTSNTGTTGLAWSTSNYQMLGNQLRIGISPGYYGTSNYLSWGTSGIVFDNYQEKLGITADKIVKGKSIAGVSGTGETGYSSCSSCCPTLASQTSATATAGDILSGKTAYVNGSKITGSMANNGAVNATIAPGGTYTIPAGYHNGSGKVTASSCPTCIGGSDAELSSTPLTYTKGMTLEAGKFYLIEGRALSTVNGPKPTINVKYGNSANVTILVSRDYGPNHNAIYTHYVIQLVKVKQSTTLEIEIKNTFSSGSTQRLITRLDP